MKFEIYRNDATGKFHFRLKAKNGQIIFLSIPFNSLQEVKKAVKVAVKSSFDDANFERASHTSGKHSFYLRTSSGKLLGGSQGYSSRSGMENGIESVKTNAINARVVEFA